MDSSMPNVIYYQSLKNADLENLLTQIHSTAKCATNCGETGPASAVSERLSKPLAVTPYEEPIEDCCAPLGHILPVTINEIINLNNFLLIKSADEQVYSKMEHRMKQFYEKNGHSFPMQQIKRNHFYVIKCGEKWLRAQVINQNRNFFFCWLIDYGYTEVLRSDQFYPLDRQFAHLPKRSFKASLNGKLASNIICICLELIHWPQMWNH